MTQANARGTRAHDGVSNAVILHAIDELRGEIGEVKGTVADLTKRFDALPDSFTPRREAVEITDRLRDRQGDHDRRITQLEEWQRAQTDRQHAAELLAVQSVGQVAATTTTQVAAATVATTQQVAGVRSASDAKLIALLTAGLTTIGGTILGYILTHLIH